MINLIGTYECTVDNKGRIMIPAQLKKQLDGFTTEPFILKRSVFQNCLELFPYSEWKLMMDKVNKLNRFVKKNNDFIRMYTAGVKSIDLDSTGRLLVPKDLIAISKLTKNVVLSSSINIIEIWDKDEYEKSINDPKVDFAKLTEEVMGNDQDNVS
jgi:MraZ protein|tara:strand:- start:262 stop:726 length:465 start_codon:yes stop_codon:yes gene_type:complete